MAVWITPYLHRSPNDLTVDAIQQGISPADWLTLGDDVGMAPEDVKTFMAQLRWSDERLEFSIVPERRPVQLHVWTNPSHVAEELTEIGERDLTRWGTSSRQPSRRRLR